MFFWFCALLRKALTLQYYKRVFFIVSSSFFFFFVLLSYWSIWNSFWFTVFDMVTTVFFSSCLPSCPSNVYRNPPFSSLNKMPFLLHTKFLRVFGSISGLFILFYWSYCPCISILIISAPSRALVFVRATLPSSKLFFNIFFFSYELENYLFCFHYPKNPIGIFVWIPLNHMLI